MKKRKSKRASQVFKEKNPIETHKPSFLTTIQKIKRFFKSTWGVISILITILGFMYLPPIKKLWQTQHAAFIEGKYITGVLIPPYYFNSYDDIINIDLGTIIFQVHKSDLINGVDYKPNNYLMIQNENPINISLKLINDRIYISTVFKDLENEEIVGIIEYNSWRLLNSNIIDYYNDDQNLEVIDKDNNVVMSLTFDPPNTIRIKGYIVGKQVIFIADSGLNTVFKSEKNYKNEASKYIQRIRHKHNFSKD